VIAAFASTSVDISTKPKPRDWPEKRSVTTLADRTVPDRPKGRVLRRPGRSRGAPPAPLDE
jgi:hypothetical protein